MMQVRALVLRLFVLLAVLLAPHAARAGMSPATSASATTTSSPDALEDSRPDKNSIDAECIYRLVLPRPELRLGKPRFGYELASDEGFEGDNIVATTNFGTAVQDKYFYDGVDHPLRLLRAGQSTYFEIDLAGNVRRLRGSGGNDLGGYRYSAFGKTVANTASVDQPMRWQGRWIDPVTGLYDVRARQWSPGIGAFVQIDEYAFHTMNTTLWGWPRQNPAARRDPTGHKDLFACMKSTPFGDFGKLLACWTSGPDSLDIGSGTIFRGMDPNAGARQKAEEAWNKAYDDCIARGGSWKKCQEEADKAEDAKLIELGLPPKNQTQCGGLPIAPAPFPIPVVP